VGVLDEAVVFEEADVAEGGLHRLTLIEGEFAEALAGDFGFEVFMGSDAFQGDAGEVSGGKDVEHFGLDRVLVRLIPMSFGNPTFVRLIVGRASRLPLNGLRSQARRPRYIQKSKSNLLLVLVPMGWISTSCGRTYKMPVSGEGFAETPPRKRPAEGMLVSFSREMWQ
jgi:hypothetical protein